MTRAEQDNDPEQLYALLQDALSDEDRRLGELEARIQALRAARARAVDATGGATPQLLDPPTERAPELDELPDTEDEEDEQLLGLIGSGDASTGGVSTGNPEDADVHPELVEARRLLEESSGFLRELGERIDAAEDRLEGSEAPEAADVPPLTPPPAGPVRERGPARTRAQPRVHEDEPAADPRAYDLTRAFGGPGGEEPEPSWARVLLNLQERVLAALDRIDRRLEQSLAGSDPAGSGALARAERAERLWHQARASLEERDRRLQALEGLVAAGLVEPAPAPRPAPRPASSQTPRAAPPPHEGPISARHLRATLLNRPSELSLARHALEESARHLRAAEAEEDPRLARLQDELLRMSSDHRALLEAHSRLLERLVDTVDDGLGEERSKA